MKKLIPSGGNDKIYTPPELCEKIVRHFIPPCVSVLEPCKGTGNFYNELFNCCGLTIDWCEIDEGKDFFEYHEKTQWIITNPPFSIFRKFLIHSMELADHIVFLCPVNHIIGLKARMRDIKQHGFYIREIAMIDTPKCFPSSGFQWAANYLNKEKGDCKITELEYEE